ncbi:hypothetical protein [Actinoallomurus iriomotensis]|uniref:Leucine rich repeat variant domain-containing protein n=1 Tax=Actinoallomurus iriomotensis TaxID=478107 RepID=A0A9W6S0P9_9ACTN|nr:hypothetical protein [Actinoallomurus iriomotensis]GLY83522.1 hypothetical protein Airi02_014520 [Actinoallomurus iriomotensis]
MTTEPDEGPRHLHTPADHLRLAADPATGEDVLRGLSQSPYPFVWQALAANPNTPPAVLGRLCSQRDSTWNDNLLVARIACHPRADRTVLRGLLDELRDRLMAGDRPFAAVLALAERVEVTPDEILGLARLPGASARLRRGVRSRLAGRAAVGE